MFCQFLRKSDGVVDPFPEDAPWFVKDYHSYYKTPRGYHERSGNSTDGWNVTGTISFLNQPLLDKAGEIKNSKTGKAFIGKLPLTLEMSELNGNEKYCYGLELPRADKHYDSIAAGDLMLYSGNCIVLFYGSAGGYSYTR